MRLYAKLKIQNKILLIVSVLVTVSLITLGMESFRTASDIVKKLAHEEMKRLSTDLGSTIKVAYNLNMSCLKHSIDIASRTFLGKVELSKEEFINAEIEDQITHAKKTIKLPVMLHEGLSVNNTTALINQISDTTGTTATLFQVIPEGLLRISTTIKKKNGKLAIGTYIPTSSKVYKTVMNGDTYLGRSFVVNGWYLTAYRPLKDKNKKIIGVVYTGVSENNLRSYFDKVKREKIRENGYYYAVDSKGILRLHPSLEDTDLYDTKDSDGKFFIRDIIKLKEGELTYQWFSQKKNRIVEKIGYVTYIKEMDWHVVSSAEMDDFTIEVEKLKYAISTISILAIAISVLIIVFVLRRLLSNPLKKVLSESSKMTDAINEGNLKVRGITDDLPFEFVPIISGMNNMTEAILKPMLKAAEVLSQMADKNLDTTFEGEYIGDYQILKESVNKTIEAFNTSMNQVQRVGNEVNLGARQVSQSANGLSQGATEQAASLEEITSSMSEIGSQTKENAGNASETLNLSNQAKDNAKDGDGKMDEMVDAMQDINQSSESISKIIKVIDEIAFQTNLLALNAAVEAARAGKHGKGFAVVAEEVRNLAARSAQAAKETTTMIEDSLSKVEKGSGIVSQTSQALKKIVDDSTKVTELVSEIVDSSNDQNSKISQIVAALSQIDQVTQSNTASAEQSAAASKELSAQAEHLNSVISEYKLKK